jgi:hypothetical protein
VPLVIFPSLDWTWTWPWVWWAQIEHSRLPARDRVTRRRECMRTDDTAGTSLLRRGAARRLPFASRALVGDQFHCSSRRGVVADRARSRSVRQRSPGRTTPAARRGDHECGWILSAECFYVSMQASWQIFMCMQHVLVLLLHT